MIGEYLYQLSPRDISGALLIPYHQSTTSAVAASGLIVLLPTIPPDQALWLQTLLFQAAAGGAQTVVHGHLDYKPFGSTQVFQLAGANGEPPQQLLYAGGPMNILLAPGGTLQADITFSGGVAVNAGIITATGWLIPRGNLGAV